MDLAGTLLIVGGFVAVLIVLLFGLRRQRRWSAEKERQRLEQDRADEERPTTSTRD